MTNYKGMLESGIRKKLSNMVSSPLIMQHNNKDDILLLY